MILDDILDVVDRRRREAAADRLRKQRGLIEFDTDDTPPRSRRRHQHRDEWDEDSDQRPRRGRLHWAFD